MKSSGFSLDNQREPRENGTDGLASKAPFFFVHNPTSPALVDACFVLVFCLALFNYEEEAKCSSEVRGKQESLWPVD
jgi:hypothetical protein